MFGPIDIHTACVFARVRWGVFTGYACVVWAVYHVFNIGIQFKSVGFIYLKKAIFVYYTLN